MLGLLQVTCLYAGSSLGFRLFSGLKRRLRIVFFSVLLFSVVVCCLRLVAFGVLVSSSLLIDSLMNLGNLAERSRASGIERRFIKT